MWGAIAGLAGSLLKGNKAAPQIQLSATPGQEPEQMPVKKEGATGGILKKIGFMKLLNGGAKDTNTHEGSSTNWQGID